MNSTTQIIKNKNSYDETFQANNKLEIEQFNYNRFLLFLEKYEVKSFWHMTHKENISAILKNGLLSNRDAYANFNPKDISDASVQKWRERPDCIYNKPIKEYVPLYISVKNPMLYRRKEIQHEICLIEISPSALIDKKFIFSDGNAASRDTKFFSDLNDLNNLPWDVLGARYWSDFTDGKRKKCAEFLVHPKIEPKHIIQIHCNNLVTFNFLSKLNCNSLISKNLFF